MRASKMPLMPKNAANRSDKLPACRKGRFGLKAVDKQVATATRCGELLVATSAASVSLSYNAEKKSKRTTS